MVHQLSICVFFILFAFSYGGSFSYCTNFILTTPYFDSTNVRFNSQINDGKYVTTHYNQKSSVVSPAVSCSSTYMNAYQWYLDADYTGCTSLSDFGLGLWVNFESTKGTLLMKIGNFGGYTNTYQVNSDADGTLKFTFKVISDNIDVDDFSISVPLNTWTLLLFHWIDSTFEIFMPGQAMISKTASGAYPFAKPDNGDWQIGYGIKAKIYQILGFKSATINTDFSIITLSDGTNSLDVKVTCPTTCTDSACHPTQKCLSQTSDCSNCDTTGCLACTTNTRNKATYCNIITCAAHSVCSPVGDFMACEHGYYLYKPLSGDAVCTQCKDSCTSCDKGKGCFQCADAIAKDGTTCRVDSIGYYVSLEGTNIKIDFGSPLVSALNIVSLTAKSSQGVAIDTSQWTVNACAVGATSCTIVTNLDINKLPITYDFEFAQA
ncbi:unnamed protein product [Blepharisma stoltei]|uniref:Uncharacterized protein n=1 Tax=Blepharisma stoltei TaxID=1481888 RepID=A0AAU9J2M9_9CILI|nr:unnamed protein product [Blepharisma stoltei]